MRLVQSVKMLSSSVLFLALCGFLSEAKPIHEKHRPFACPALPGNLSSYSNTVLPSPFTFANGQPVSSLADWSCRQAEINQLFQTDELGAKPPKPDNLTATLSGSTLSITATQSGKSITFSPTITLPTTGTAPFPALIALDGGSIPHPAGVAIISFNTEDMAQQDSGSSRGLGKFYQLYGTNATAGAMMAWSWAISRIIDVLEVTPSAKIDTTRLGVTGCSRDGKGALVAGAFDDRIVLTIPQESGSGGTDSWRLSDYLLQNGVDTQTASEIIQENVWFSTNFNPFASTNTSKLPFDHHLLLGLVAPRGLFVIDNVGIDWLGPWSSWGAGVAAQTIYKALGATDSFGVSQAASHDHCAFPSAQQPELTAFINRFLLKQSANTTVFETAGNSTFPSSWYPWSVPTLS